MTFRVGIDVGGTFTDLVVADDDGRLTIFKASTTPGQTSQGIFDTLELAAEHHGVALEGLLGQCATVVYSGTIGTNAVVTNTAAKVGLICTEGFRDILLLREGPRKPSAYDSPPYPEPYVPRYLTMPVAERVNAEGGVDVYLDEDEVREAIRAFKNWDVEAVAVSFLWSVANPVHEKRVGEIIAQEWPRIPYVLSHELNPIVREYRRTASAVIDASLQPILSVEIERIDRDLNERGFRGTLLVGGSAGGVITPREAARRPIYTVGSGPALGPVAGRYLAETDEAGSDVIVLDMGGTSFDVSVVTDGSIAVSREAMVKDEILGISRVDVKSIGSGGGSIAWVDSGGLIHVGPQSGGADPGPACYNRGGEQPTVSDANVELGYLNPDFFLGGRVKLAPELASKAIEDGVGKPLGLSVPDAAFTIFTTVNQDMTAAIQDITIWQGVDPREYVIVAGGGAVGMHIVPIAQELGVKRILVPKVAGTLSAVGATVADVTAEFSRSYFTESSRFDYDGVNSVLGHLTERASEFLSASSPGAEETTLDYFVEARYPFQVWEITVPMRAGEIPDDGGLKRLVEDFHDVHERMFAIKEPGQNIECVVWKAQASVKTPDVALREIAGDGRSAQDALAGHRSAYFQELGGFVETPVYRGDRLAHGNEIEAPAIIEEQTSTLVVFPGSRVRLTRWGNYLMELD